MSGPLEDAASLQAALLEQGTPPEEADALGPVLLQLRAWEAPKPDAESTQRLTAILSQGSRQPTPVYLSPVPATPAAWREQAWLHRRAPVQVPVDRSLLRQLPLAPVRSVWRELRSSWLLRAARPQVGNGSQAWQRPSGLCRAQLAPPNGSAWRELAGLLRLARLQVQVVEPAFWLSSAVIVLLGALLLVGRPDPQRVLLLYLVGPLLGYLGVAMAFHGSGFGLLECELACPPSPRQLTVARLVVVLGYLLALGALLDLSTGLESAGQLTLHWLTPLLAEVGVTLVASTRLRVERAAGIVYAAWVTGLGVLWMSSSTPVALSLAAELVLAGVGVLAVSIAVYRLPRELTSDLASA